MRHDVTFPSKGLTCRGRLHVPDGLAPGERAPAVVMAHGFSGVKELDLPRFAERFCAAGFVTLVFDFRFLGESEGEPRAQVLPREQQEDYRNAITWLSQRPEVDADRIGAWGTSYSGGHVLHLGAFDRRIKAVVAQVPNVSAWRGIVLQHGHEAFHLALGLALGDRVARYPDEAVHYLPVVAPPGEPCVLSTPDAYEWFLAADPPPTWENRVSAESVEQLLEYDPAGPIELVAPTPLLVIAAEHDALIPLASVEAAFDRAREPKQLLVLGCGHFDVYATEPWHEQAAGAATDWFRAHLHA